MKEKENGWNGIRGEDQRVKIERESFCDSEEGGTGMGVDGEKTTCENRTSLM